MNAPVATAEARVAAPAPPVALYIHVPFCVSLCPYCDFVVYAGAAARGPRARIGAFLDAVLAEIDLRADALDDRFGPAVGRRSKRVYLGGGTPSLLPADEIERLLARVRERFGVAEGAEITLEANPGPDERGDPAALRRAGVTRISFGAQSLDDGELRRLGRRHAPATWRTRSRAPARRASGRSTWTSSTTCPTERWRPGPPRWAQRSSSRPTTCRCTR